MPVELISNYDQPSTRRHHLKTWHESFDAVSRRVKNFEVRLNDRGFQLGDVLVLREYDPDLDEFSGRYEEREITYIVFGGEWGLPEGICVLGWGCE